MIKRENIKSDMKHRLFRTYFELPNSLWNVESENSLLRARASARRLVDTKERSWGVRVLFGPVADDRRSSMMSKAGLD